VANFFVSLPRTLDFEGAYLGKDAPGGEYFMGIERSKHGDWPGWSTIAVLLKTGSTQDLLSNRTLLSELSDFYRVNYWQRLACDHLADQNLADELFDSAVNMGPLRTTKMLQRALNALRIHKKSPLFDALKADSVLGARTLAALEALTAVDQGADLLLKTFESLRRQAYLEVAEQDPKFSQYMKDWLKRVGHGA
jgi:lysozyme family protein